MFRTFDYFLIAIVVIHQAVIMHIDSIGFTRFRDNLQKLLFIFI